MAVVTQAPLQIDKALCAAALPRHTPLVRDVTRPVRLLLAQARIKREIRPRACLIAVYSLGHTPQPELTIKFDRGTSLRLVYSESGNERCTSLISNQGDDHACMDCPDSMSVTTQAVEPASLSDTASPFGESHDLHTLQLLSMCASSAASMLVRLCPASKRKPFRQAVHMINAICRDSLQPFAAPQPSNNRVVCKAQDHSSNTTTQQSS